LVRPWGWRVGGEKGIQEKVQGSGLGDDEVVTETRT
jgi:hypothetical protein